MTENATPSDLLHLKPTRELEKAVQAAESNLADQRKRAEDPAQTGSCLSVNVPLAESKLAADIESLEQGRKRDAIQAGRPAGCVCLGTGRTRLGNPCSCPEGEPFRREAEKKHVELVERRMDEAGIPARFRHMSLAHSPLDQSILSIFALSHHDETEECVRMECSTCEAEWAQMARLRRSWYLWGPYGTGKTSLAICIALILLDNFAYLYGYDEGCVGKLVFTSTPDLLSRLRDTYNGRESELDVVEHYANAHILILDDIGAEHCANSEWLADRLYQIIGARHGEERTTIFTSNLGLPNLAERIGERITWRIVEMCGRDNILKIDGRNLRDEHTGSQEPGR